MRYVKNRPGLSGDKALWTAAILAHDPEQSAQEIADEVGVSVRYVRQIRNSNKGLTVELVPESGEQNKGLTAELENGPNGTGSGTGRN